MLKSELHHLSIQAVLKLGDKQNGWITAAIIVGDAAHFALAIWISVLTYELSKLVAMSMDRGEKHEQAKIRLYSWVGHSSITIFLAVKVVLAITFTGYSRYAYVLLLTVWLLQILALVYMVAMVARLKINGRNYESVHGRFVASPLYWRLKWIMLVYALFAFQYQFSSLIMYLAPNQTTRLGGYAGVSYVLYYLRGFVLSIVTGCSQPCVLRCFRCCIPEDLMTSLTQRRDCVTIPGALELPYINPVFVFTDIESSSALWAIGDGRVMQQATQVHDDLLKSLLASFRGYEITTAGDSFHLAFHTIREATEYCLEAQIRLLNAKWPSELHGLVPATAKVRVGGKIIFRGLRVRMGIHDAVGSEGSLIQDVHVVTGKLTYTGVSEVIANEIGDLGSGGQILITKRVAEWLFEHSSQVTMTFIIDPVCAYSIPKLNTMLDVFQVVPKALTMRCERFYSPGRVIQVERANSRLDTESQTFLAFLQISSYNWNEPL